jgi:hypothetical protein
MYLGLGLVRFLLVLFLFVPGTSLLLGGSSSALKDTVVSAQRWVCGMQGHATCVGWYLAVVVGSNGLVVLRLELVGLGYVWSLGLKSTTTIISSAME